MKRVNPVFFSIHSGLEIRINALAAITYLIFT